MQHQAVAVAKADQRRHKADRLMQKPLPFAFRLAALNTMGGGRRVM